MQATSLGAAEATLNVRVIRKDGRIEEMQGSPVIDIDALVAEYKRAVSYCQQLEAVMAQIPELKERMK